MWFNWALGALLWTGPSFAVMMYLIAQDDRSPPPEGAEWVGVLIFALLFAAGGFFVWAYPAARYIDYVNERKQRSNHAEALCRVSQRIRVENYNGALYYMYDGEMPVVSYRELKYGLSERRYAEIALAAQAGG